MIAIIGQLETMKIKKKIVWIRRCKLTNKSKTGIFSYTSIIIVTKVNNTLVLEGCIQFATKIVIQENLPESEAKLN